jgi:hypothetical protein
MTLEGLLVDQEKAAVFWSMMKEETLYRLFLLGDFPSRKVEYHGALMSYFYLPFHALFGPNWAVARLWPLLFVVPSLLFAYAFMRNIFGAPAALLSLALLVIHPGYVIGARHSGFVFASMHFFSMGAMWLLARWWIERRTVFFFLAMFFVGMGLSTQLWFVWFFNALAVLGFLFAPAVARRMGLRDRRRLLSWTAAGLGGLALGAALLFYREIVYSFGPARAVLGAVLGSENSSFAYGAAFRAALETLTDFWWTCKWIPFTGVPFAGVENPRANDAYPWTVLAAALFLVVRGIGKGKSKALVTLPVILGAFILQMPLSPTSRPIHHVYFFYPFPALVLACAAWELVGMFRGKRSVRAVVAAGVIAFMAREVASLERCFSVLVTRGGVGFFTESIYDLARWLRERHPSGETLFLYEPAGDEVRRHLLFLLPNHSFRVVLIRGRTPTEIEANLAATFRSEEPDGLLIDAPVFSHPEFMAVARSWAARAGLSLDVAARFEDETGDLSFGVYAVAPVPSREGEKPGRPAPGAKADTLSP